MAGYQKFLNCITVAELKRLSAEQNPSEKQYTLQTPHGGILNTKERLFDAAYHSLPIPSSPLVRLNWDALADDLRVGFHFLKCNHVNIIWPFADDVAASSMVFLVKAVKFFKQVAEALSSYSYDSGPNYEVAIRLFLVCSNEKSRGTLDAEFWFLE